MEAVAAVMNSRAAVLSQVASATATASVLVRLLLLSGQWRLHSGAPNSRMLGTSALLAEHVAAPLPKLAMMAVSGLCYSLRASTL